ncbi:hypothetical protein FPV67DRAFT_1722066 [Lyophyllum atratum]|nr:hypothetical protein FPV67DRAFT_1722066 [Lyophyllum atratum]
MSDDEFDDIPDEFSGVEGVNWDELLSAPLPPSSAVAHHHSSDHEDLNRSPSTHYSFDDEELNHDFLAELDDLEKNILQGGTGPSGAVDAHNTRVHGDSELARRDGGICTKLDHFGDSSLGDFLASKVGIELTPEERQNGEMILVSASHCGSSSSSLFTQVSSETLIHLSRFFSDVASPSPEFSKVDGIGDVDPNQQVSLKRPRSDSLSPRGQSPSKKGKGKAQGNEGVWQVLSEFEDELTCPICSDIFVAAHLANPCGHSFCGDCGWQWKMKGKSNCLICRTEFSRETPMIPNFAMDNTVEKHISALGQSGLAEWKLWWQEI